MQEYNIGRDEISASDLPEGCEWVVIDYESGNWEGDGTAIAKKGNTLIIIDLSHCSCYGPFDQQQSNMTFTIEQWKSNDIHAIGEISRKMTEKVNELLNWSAFTATEDDVRFLEIDE